MKLTASQNNFTGSDILYVEKENDLIYSQVRKETKVITVMKTLGVLTFFTAMGLALTSVAEIRTGVSSVMAQNIDRDILFNQNYRNAQFYRSGEGWCARTQDRLREELSFLRERRERRIEQGRPTYEVETRMDEVRSELRSIRRQCG